MFNTNTNTLDCLQYWIYSNTIFFIENIYRVDFCAFSHFKKNYCQLLKIYGEHTAQIKTCETFFRQFKSGEFM